MFCTGCGSHVYEDEAFCADCGRKVIPRDSRPPQHPTQDMLRPTPQTTTPFRRPAPGPPVHRRPGPAPLPHRSSPQPPVSHIHDYPVATPQPPTGYMHGHPVPNPHPPTHYMPGPHMKPEHEINTRQRQSGGRLQTVIAVICIVLIALCIGVVGFSLLRNVETDAIETPTPPPANGADNQDHYTYEPTHTPPPTVYDDDIPRSARFPFPGIISRHTSNTADIVFLQNTLNIVRNHYTSVRPIDTAGGNFDGATRGAVIDFQVRAGLPPTGIVDEDTWYGIIEVFENPPETPDAPFIPQLNTEYVTLVNLHLREAPTQFAYSLGIKPEGTVVTVLNYIPVYRWFFVTTADDIVGYMKAEFLLMKGILP